MNQDGNGEEKIDYLFEIIKIDQMNMRMAKKKKTDVLLEWSPG